MVSLPKLNAIVWWNFARDNRVLCRIVQLDENFVVLRILAATAEQVLLAKYGVGEHVNVLWRGQIIEAVE